MTTTEIRASDHSSSTFYVSSQSSLSSNLIGQAGNPSTPSTSANANSGSNVSGGEKSRDVVAEGMLCKYTNVVNGWKNRWFVLNKDVLEYYEKEDHKCSLQKPRGTLSIFGAIVVPSDDDSLTFTLTTQSGHILKLKASDQKERSFWISRLRQAATLSVSSSILWSASSSQLPLKHPLDSPLLTPRRTVETMQANTRPDGEPSPLPSGLTPATTSQSEQRISSAISQAQSSYAATCRIRDKLRESIERIPNRSLSLDCQLLQLKANASAVCIAIDQCISTVRKQPAASKTFNASLNGRPAPVQPPNGSSPMNLTVATSTTPTVQPEVSPKGRPNRAFTEPGMKIAQTGQAEQQQRSNAASLLAIVPTLPSIDHDKAVDDTERYHEKGIGNVEPQRPVILQMLAELKLGMDLTRVSLPTFILEKRSLLEMFADCMGHPDLFLKIGDQPDPGSRMKQVLLWYLTSIHAGRQGDISKKPYNPLIGETFHCCWDVVSGSGTARIKYTGEQVSHHPPVSAFYFECPAKAMTLTGSIWTKSQYLGMSIGAQMIGHITLNLLGRGEQYVMTLPSAYARSILSYPWVELGDRCTINCPQTGYCSSVVFHTKGAYGGTLHRVSGEVQPPNSSTPSLRFSGEWTGRMDFNSSSGEAFTIDVAQLKLFPKRVRPLALQSEWESRRLWQAVTEALKAGDIDAATTNKKILEEQQRQAERTRKDKNITYHAKYFDRTGSTELVWVSKTQLKASSQLASESRSPQTNP